MIIRFLLLFSRLFRFFSLLRRIASFGLITANCFTRTRCMLFFFPI